MSCLITQGRLVPCKEFIGGLYKVWFANFGTVNPILDANNVITNLSGATTVFEYELKGTSKLDQEITSSRDNGTTFVTQTLQLELQGGDFNFNNQIKLLSYGRPHCFVQDNYGSNWYVGRFRGVDVTKGLHSSGGAIADKYGYSITLVGMENEYANFVSGSTITNPWGAIVAKPTVTVGT